MGIRTSALALAIIGLGSAGCSSPAGDKPTATVQKTAVVTLPTVYPSEKMPCLLPEYDLEMVQASAKTAEQAKLSTALVAKMVRQNPGLPPLFKEYNEYWQLYALDTVRCKEFSIVSYLYQHEDCCSDVYYLTFTPDGKKVTDWAVIAQTGADGMWGATAAMGTQQNRLRVTVLTENEGEGLEEVMLRDSVVTDFSVTPQGRFVRTRIDSVRTKRGSR